MNSNLKSETITKPDQVKIEVDEIKEEKLKGKDELTKRLDTDQIMQDVGSEGGDADGQDVKEIEMSKIEEEDVDDFLG